MAHPPAEDVAIRPDNVKQLVVVVIFLGGVGAFLTRSTAGHTS
jgi:hypothetical protein